jgi:hypothetical protein
LVLVEEKESQEGKKMKEVETIGECIVGKEDGASPSHLFS